MLEKVLAVLKKSPFTISNQSRMPSNYGDVVKLSNGCVINCWDKGTYSFQGKNIAEVKDFFESHLSSSAKPMNNKVFVVYGHDNAARVQLEAMLRRWDLEPLILDQLVSSGQTIIEKLEEYTSQVEFGIVLATPDDIGYPKNDESKKRSRVRQNVVLELGMLLSAIGRQKVAILLKTSEDMESPSDIHGLIYIPFKDNIEETKLSLAKEMQSNGYILEISKL